MNAKQKAAQIYDQYWADVSRKPVSKQDPLPDIRPLIEKALIEAEEAKAKAEREACALIADKYEREAMAQLEESKLNGKGLSEIGHVFEASAAKWIADAIRARSKLQS